MWIATFDTEHNLFLTDSEMEEMRAEMVRDIVKDRQKYPELARKYSNFSPEQAVDEIISQYYKKKCLTKATSYGII